MLSTSKIQPAANLKDSTVPVHLECNQNSDAKLN